MYQYIKLLLCFNYVSVLCISVSDEKKKNLANFRPLYILGNRAYFVQSTPPRAFSVTF